jgi:hypothetical protein
VTAQQPPQHPSTGSGSNPASRVRTKTKRRLIMLAVITAGFLILLGGCSALLIQIGENAIQF